MPTNHIGTRSASAKTGRVQDATDTAALALDTAAANDRAAQRLATGRAKPLSITTGDFDGDGTVDLIGGFVTPDGGAIVLNRGNLDAFAPQSDESFQAIGRGEFPPPFLAEGLVTSVPARPDFIAAGHFTASGRLDLAISTLGGDSVYILAGDGHGGFSLPAAVQLKGTVTTMAAGQLGQGRSLTNLLVGITKPDKAHALLVLSQNQTGLSVVASFELAGPVTNIRFGDFGDRGLDAAFFAGGEVMLLHSSTMQLELLNLPTKPVAMDLGTFLYDRNPDTQIALLDADGSLQIAVHNEFDPRVRTVDEMRAIREAVVNQQASPLIPHRAVAADGWKIAETISSTAPLNEVDPPLMFRTRISDNGSDDIMILNSAVGQMAVVSHANATPGASSFVPAQVTTRPYSGSAVAAVPIRVNIDGRPGIVALNQGQVAAVVMMPLPDPTFFPNRFDDITPRGTAVTCLNTTGVDASNDCTLREAVLKANATAGTDTIQLQAGTYTLSLPKVTNDFSGAHGALYLNDSLNIVGAGQNSTIIQAGTTNANGVDLVMAVNEDINPITNATASISNLTMRFGRNNGTHGNDGDGGCMEFDTGSSGTANLSLTNVTLTDCSTTQGNGGGLVIFNFIVNGPGLATITNSIIQNNTVNETVGGPSGGGIFVSFPARMLMTNSQVINNRATQLNGAGRGIGGGIRIFSNTSGSRQTVIHSSSISGNQASGPGGGIWNSANLLIDQGTSITGNAAGANGGGSQDGGGIFHNSINPDTMTLSKVTITGNTATGNGGGIFSGNLTGGGPATLSFSRLAGNNATGAGNNINNVNSAITATNDWWGTNSPANTIVNASGGTTTFDPFIVLTHTANPATIRINQSATLTADMSKDNHGVGTALAGNLDVLNGLPVTFNNPVDGSIPDPQPEALNPGAQATATFNAGGAPGGAKADATVDQATVTANIVVLSPLQITKSFNPTMVAVNAFSTLTINVTNPNVIAVDAGFTDTLPSNLVVAATPGVTNTCAGTVTATAGSGSIGFSNASLAVGNCTITLNVSSAVDSVYDNSVTINSTAAGTGPQSTSSASLTVINPPTISKVFGASSIPLNGTTSLTLTLNSTNANQTLNGVAFTDNLPAGLIVAATPNLNSTCGGTATAVGGSSSVSLSGVTLAPAASCTVSLDVQGTTSGVKSNTVQATSTNGGTSGTSNASISVIVPPVIIKAFGAASIPLNGATSLTFTIQNNNTTTAFSGGVGFSDTLPGGLVISTPNGLTGTCGSGTITATAGTNVISLSGGSVAASSSCAFSVNVTGTAAGTQNNTTGNVSSIEGGTGGTASASINVVAPPSIAKVFNPSTIALNATTSLTFTITNPSANVVSLTGVAFTDALPTGLTVANASATVCGGTVTTTAPTGIAISGATIAANSQCQFSVTVTGAASGNYTNTTGNVTSTNGGTGNTGSANLTVAAPGTIAKSFGAASIPLNGTTTLTFNLTNPGSSVTLTGLAFTDNLPAGLVVAPTPGVSNTCGGSVNATAGASSVSLSAGTLAAGASCALSVNVQGTTAGVKNNSVQVTSTEGGTGNTANASVTVVGAPVIIKAFGAASIPLNGATSLTFTIQNNSSGAQTGVGFSDTLPGGLVISTPNGLTGTCGSGTITATAGTNVISLSGGSVAASSSCTFSANVTGTAAGTQNNTTGNVSSLEGGTGGAASASINVVAPPSIAKVFNPSTIALNATTSLTFTITNPSANAVSLTGVAFTDTLPTGLTVANASATVCGGTVTTTAPTGIAISGATIAANSQCQFSVTVTGAASGNYTNTTGNVTSTNGGTGNTGSANLTVAAPGTITKSFGAASVPLNGTTTLTFNLTNPNTSVALTGLAFTDNLPAGLVVAPTPGISNTCGGSVNATAGASSVSLSAGALAAGASCGLSVNVQGTTAGAKNNSVQVTSTEAGPGNTSNASIIVIGPPVIIKAFGAASIPLNSATSLTFTIQNNNTTTTLTGIGFSDTLPGGLVISTPNGLTGTCGGGTITATAGSISASLSGASLAASTSCTFSVNVTGTTNGAKNNTTGNVTSTEGGTGGTASASLEVEGPPSIAKAFNPTSIPVGGTSRLTLTITNSASNGAPLAGVAVTDNLPAGLVVATPNGLTNTCGGTATATAGSGSVSLTGGTVAINSNCAISVNVTSSVAGHYINTTGAVSSTNGGTGNTATANLSVANPPTITKAFGSATITVGGTTTLSFTITNPNAMLPLTGVAFTDALPAGLIVPNGVSSTCGGGTLTASGGNTIALSGGTLAAGASCTFSVIVTGVTGGVKDNTTGAISATETGPGATSNTATLTVIAPPTITKAFGTPTVPLGGKTTLTFTVANPNPTDTLSGISFTDILPIGLTVGNSTAPTCDDGSGGPGGTLTTTSPRTISLAGGAVAPGASCVFSVTVTGAAAGVWNNTSGLITSTNGGAGGTSNTATITVLAPPVITKAFSAPTVNINTPVTLTFTIINPNTTVALTGVSFTDTFPTGMVVATPPSVSNPCGGAFAAVGGASSVSLSGMTVPAGGSCTISVNVVVTSATPPVKDNTTSPITSDNGGIGAPSNTARLATFDMCIYDPTTRKLLQFSSVTGAWQFIDCGKGRAPVTGTGLAQTAPGGCKITLTVPDPGGSTKASGITITATANICTGVGTASVTINGVTSILRDPNVNDGTCSCPVP